MCRCAAILLMMLQATLFSAGLQNAISHTRDGRSWTPGHAFVSPHTLCLVGVEEDSSDLGEAWGGQRAGYPRALLFECWGDRGKREPELGLGLVMRVARPPAAGLESGKTGRGTVGWRESGGRVRRKQRQTFLQPPSPEMVLQPEWRQMRVKLCASKLLGKP